MKKFKVRATYTFEGYWVVEADSRSEAREIVANACGIQNLVVDKKSHALDWDFDMKPTKETIGNGSIISTKSLPEYRVLMGNIRDAYIKYKSHAFYETEDGKVSALCGLMIKQNVDGSYVDWEDTTLLNQVELSCGRCKKIVKKRVLETEEYAG